MPRNGCEDERDYFLRVEGLSRYPDLGTTLLTFVNNKRAKKCQPATCMYKRWDWLSSQKYSNSAQ